MRCVLYSIGRLDPWSSDIFARRAQVSLTQKGSGWDSGACCRTSSSVWIRRYLYRLTALGIALRTSECLACRVLHL